MESELTLGILVTLFCGLLINFVTATNVHEVNVGDTAVLHCPSNDDDHRFQYWQLFNEQILGPKTDFNKHKYKYEVWSGNLFIKSTSTQEAGIYRCISKSIQGPSLSVAGVELVVKRDWEDSFENDAETNTYRAVIGILVLLILLLVGGLAFIVKKRRSHQFKDMTRDESPEDQMTNLFDK